MDRDTRLTTVSAPTASGTGIISRPAITWSRWSSRLKPTVYGTAAANPTRPLYQVVQLKRRSTSFGGDQYIPAVPPPACAGAMHTVDVAGVLPDDVDRMPIDNPSFAAEGGSPFEGMDMPLCDVKLVNLGNGKSIAPNFQHCSPRCPSRASGRATSSTTWRYLLTRRSLTFGEKAGLADSPIGSL